MSLKLAAPGAARPSVSRASFLLRSLRRWTPRVALGVWFGTMLLVAAGLMAKHLFPLPIAQAAPSAPPPSRGFAALRLPEQQGQWLMVHVLYLECRCSARVIDHLLATQRPTSVGEHVVLVGSGEQEQAALTRAGFHVRFMGRDELARELGVEAGPLLVVLDPTDRVGYAGGYTARKQSLEMHDLEVLALLVAGVGTDQLPIYGCPVSTELAQAMNPLGI